MAYRSVHVFKYDSRNKVQVHGVTIGLPIGLYLLWNKPWLVCKIIIIVCASRV